MTLQLHTPRLLLRPVDEDDLDALLAIRSAPAVVSTTGTSEALPRERMADQLGKGFALEAGLAAARDLFERVGLDRVYVGVDPDNEKSLRALAKAPGRARARR